MSELKLSIAELGEIFDCRFHLTSDRFVFYATTQYGYTEKQAIEAYKQLRLFPKFIQNVPTSDESFKSYDKIIPMAFEIVKNLKKSWKQMEGVEIPALNDSYKKEKLMKLCYHLPEQTELNEIEINIYDPTHIISYAKLLESGIKPVCLLTLVDEINKKPNDNGVVESMKVYDGDMFTTYDDFWGDKRSNIYVAELSENGYVSYKRLLYIKGKGYLKKNGELNYDLDSSFSSYAVTGQANYDKIGNRYLDVSMLKD